VTALPQGQLAQPGSATQPAAGLNTAAANAARAANARSDFNIGFSGYRFNGDIGAYTVRFRHYDPTPGMCRWLERDPAGYQDGPSLYSYLGRNPMAGTDPYGLSFAGAGGAEEPGRRRVRTLLPKPGSGLRRSMVGADHPAAIRQRAEDERLSRCRHPSAGTLSNHWNDPDSFAGWLDTASHMDAHETLEALKGDNPFHEWIAQNFWLRFHSEDWILSPWAVGETVAIAVVAAVLIVKGPAIARLFADDWGKVGLHKFYWDKLNAAGLANASGAAKLAWMFRTYPWLPFLAPITSVLAGDGVRLLHTGPTPLLALALRPAIWLWQQAARLWWMMLSSSTQEFDSVREALAALLPRPPEPPLAVAALPRHHQSTDST